ncbi:MAG: phosphate ABC transporter permease subunit PstC [Fibrobacterota bacterium]
MAKSRNEKFRFRDALFEKFLTANSWFLLIILLIIFVSLVYTAWPAITQIGPSFITEDDWNPTRDIYGALPFIMGTLLTSVYALLISLPVSLAIAVFLGEFSSAGRFPRFIQAMIELLAGVPSVIYGFWGIFFLVPLVRKFQIWIIESFGLNEELIANGFGLLTSSLILSIMIIPYSASVAREVITMVPADLKNAGYSLGSTRFEVIRKIVLPYARSGIVAGILLSFGRALGETMAVTMLIGNSDKMPPGFFNPMSIFGYGNTLASKIANQFPEASGMGLSALFYMALILFGISLVINVAGRIVILKMEHKVS